MFIMNRLDIKKRAQIIHMLVEGNSLRATARMADVSRNTVNKLLCDVGEACLAYQDEHLRNLPCKRVQCDEIWSFVYAKKRNITDKMPESAGDVWTWTSICSDTKIVPCWYVGDRDAESANSFMNDLAGRLDNKVQLTSDGHKSYMEAVEDAFGGNVDYAQLVKLYGPAKKEDGTINKDFNITKTRVNGAPDKGHISTSHVERNNLNMRMNMRRFIRKTNGFSKKIENHMHAVSLHFFAYNFINIHRTLKVTPAMEAGVSKHAWSLEEMAALAD